MWRLRHAVAALTLNLSVLLTSCGGCNHREGETLTPPPATPVIREQFALPTALIDGRKLFRVSQERVERVLRARRMRPNLSADTAAGLSPSRRPIGYTEEFSGPSGITVYIGYLHGRSEYVVVQGPGVLAHQDAALAWLSLAVGTRIGRERVQVRPDDDPDGIRIELSGTRGREDADHRAFMQEYEAEWGDSK